MPVKDPYRQLIRPLLFSGLALDPEWLHDSVMQILARLGQPPRGPLQGWLEQQFCLVDDRLHQSCWGLTFANPLGLAAGFDKDGAAARAWPLFGFGFAELGTITRLPQPGNPSPRLFRLVADRAILNRMGFNNQGATALAERLAPLWADQRPPIPIGINLGKSKLTPLAEAAADYQSSFKQLQPYGDYFVVNVSSPNTPGLRSLQAADQLGEIIAALQGENLSHKPLLVKISPDLDWPAIDAILELALARGLAGIIATNTTLDRQGLTTPPLTTGTPPSAEAGGPSGAPRARRATEVIRYIYGHTQGQLPIIGVGGVFTAEDAWQKITAGATLVQTYTGWVYEGPWMGRRLLQGLLPQLDHHQLGSIGEAVGLDHRR